MQLASNVVSVARVLRAGAPVTCDVLSRRYVHLDANGVGYVLRKGKFCPIVSVAGPDAVVIETVQGTLPETAALKRAGAPAAKPAPAPKADAPAAATKVTLDALAQSLVRLNDRMDKQEQAFAMFVSRVFKA